jgi:hypothetical protein
MHCSAVPPLSVCNPAKALVVANKLLQFPPPDATQREVWVARIIAFAAYARGHPGAEPLQSSILLPSERAPIAGAPVAPYQPALSLQLEKETECILA